DRGEAMPYVACMGTVLRSPPLLRRDWIFDVALALVVVAIEVAGTVLAAQQQPQSRPLDALAYTLIAVSAGSLMARRRYPALVLLAATLPMMAYYPMGYPEGAVYVAVLIALYSAAASGRLLQAIAVAVIAFLWTLIGGYLLAPE